MGHFNFPTLTFIYQYQGGGSDPLKKPKILDCIVHIQTRVSASTNLTKFLTHTYLWIIVTLG
jgi:hypothetical protein